MSDGLYLRFVDRIISADPRMPAEEIAKRAMDAVKAVVRLSSEQAEMAASDGFDIRGMSDEDAILSVVRRDSLRSLGLLCKCGRARWAPDPRGWLGPKEALLHGRYACPPEPETT